MYVAGILLIAGFAVLTAMELKNASTPYVTKVADIASFGGKVIQFNGKIVNNTVAYDRANHDLIFALRDDAGKMVNVFYDGPKPGDFDTADAAVVRGVYRDGRLKADELLLRCPSKYEGKK